MIESNLDSIAQQSRFRNIHPGTKLLLALGSLVICLVSQTPLVPLISGLTLSIVIIFPGKISPVTYLKILLGPAFFLSMSTVVLLLMLGGGEVIWQWNPVSWINLTVTTNALSKSILTFCRVFGCSISLIFLTLTTPTTDLFGYLKKLKIPDELIDLMMIAYRYIFIFYDQAFEIWQAQKMRLGYQKPAESVRSFAMLCGMLFISSWIAGEDLIRAMECRCYNGIIPLMDQNEPLKMRSFLSVLIFLIGLCLILYLLTINRPEIIWI